MSILQQAQAVSQDLAGRAAVVALRQRQVADLKAEIEQAQDQLEVLADLDLLIRACLQSAIEKKEHLERLGAAGLTATFDEDYEFKLEPVLVSGLQKGLALKIRAGQGEFDDPTASFGSGAQGVLSTVLRLTALAMLPGAPKVQILDEPVPHLSPLYWGRFSGFLQAMSQAAGIQLIMVVHKEPFGKIIGVSKENGISQATTIKPELWANYRKEFLESEYD